MSNEKNELDDYQPANPQRIYWWYRVFLFTHGAMYAFFAFLVLLALIVPTEEAAADSTLMVIGILVVFGGIAFSQFFCIFLGRRYSTWVVGFINIAFGLTNCFLLIPAGILFALWLRVETQQFFERK